MISCKELNEYSLTLHMVQGLNKGQFRSDIDKDSCWFHFFDWIPYYRNEIYEIDIKHFSESMVTRFMLNSDSQYFYNNYIWNAAFSIEVPFQPGYFEITDFIRKGSYLFTVNKNYKWVPKPAEERKLTGDTNWEKIVELVSGMDSTTLFKEIIDKLGKPYNEFITPSLSTEYVLYFDVPGEPELMYWVMLDNEKKTFLYWSKEKLKK